MKLISNELFFEEIERIILNGENVELKVKGGSMRPYLRNEKDIVVIYSHKPTDLKCGEIVLFRYRNKHILHRIVNIKDNYLIIQGDGVCNNYEKALQSDIIGIVRKVIRPNAKQISVQNFSSRFYWKCWYLLRPFRRYILAIYDRIVVLF